MEERHDIKAIERVMDQNATKVSLSSADLAEVADWQTGREYKVEMTIKQLSSDLFESGKVVAEFEVKNVKSV